ncbi:porin [Oricola sp.]|uniref:porin n=1 Tax=Oricola sp. TaxID=1979950 RepID=UPI003515198E
MKTKSLLLGSAAALFAVTGARAADAVIIPEPEMVEYVRVCDAAGTGYFYIPGTETCLKIGGYVRFQINAGNYDDEYTDSEGYVDFDTKASLQVSSWTDSEIGPIATFYEMVATANGPDDDDFDMDSAWLSVAGLKMGYFGGFLDNGINGETDSNGLENKFTSIQYTGTAGGLSFGASIDQIYDDGVWTHYDGIGFGVTGMVGFTVGGVGATLVGFYDTFEDEGGFVARASAELGMGTLQGRFTWATGMSGYNMWEMDSWGPVTDYMEWVAEVSYAAKINDKLTLTPGFSYAHSDGDDNLWRAGVTADYTIAANLAAKLSVQYEDFDDDYVTGDYNGFSGFLRFQASF